MRIVIWTRRWLPIVLSSLLLGLCENTEPRNSKPEAVVSFQVVSNGFLLIRGSLGRQNNQIFVLDTGTSAALVIDRAAADAAGLPRKAHGIVRLQGNQEIESDDWREATVRTGKIDFATGDFPTVDLSAVSQVVGVKLAGILGLPVLSLYVTKIDYTERKLSYFEPANFHYSGAGSTSALQPSGGTGLLVVNGSVRLPDCSALPVRFFLDSATDTDVTFDHSFVNRHPELAVGPRSAATGVAGVNISGTWGRLDSVEVAGLALKAPKVVALGSASSGSDDPSTDAALGFAILQEFNLIIDKPHGQVIFEPRVDKPPVQASPCVVERPLNTR